jgi:hypothetical protein
MKYIITETKLERNLQKYLDSIVGEYPVLKRIWVDYNEIMNSYDINLFYDLNEAKEDPLFNLLHKNQVREIGDDLDGFFKGIKFSFYLHFEKEDKSNITEQENSRLKNLILSNIRKGMSPDDIVKITGIPLEMVVDAIMDEKIKLDNNINDRCDKFYLTLYNLLRPAKKILKKYEYEDGSEIRFDYDGLSGSIDYIYRDSMGYQLFGYATLFYDGICVIPVDVEEYDFGDGWISKHFFKVIDMTDYAEKIKTYRDLVELHDGVYPELVKNQLDKFIEDLKQHQ